jgi:tetratricopeptide (TPR) repeat protein
MVVRVSRADLLWLAAIFAGIAAIYLPGLGNALLFDDAQLADGQLFAKYARPELAERALSYGSFVWLKALAGEGWWKQRVANLAIHAAVVVALWGLYREILRHVAVAPAPGAAPGQAPEDYGRSPALWIAIGFFALNPAAVYAVAYLIQRSILLATLFVVAGLWLFARGLAQRRPVLHVAALACYALALTSKEHAVLAPLAAVPVYILVARPSARRLAAISAAGAALAALAGFALYQRFGEILGKPFDEFSQLYLQQLSALDPEAARNAWPLSIMNQSYLFFEYGLRWLVPWSGWMSINMRPAFPVTWLSFPQVLGIAGYLAAVAGGFYLVVKHRDWRALVGISILLPALLFATEFATVWVQDPFVIYRSYLWAIGVPGLVFFFVHGPSLRASIAIALALASLLGWQSFDRVLSLSTPERAFTDAIAKLPDDPRAVGRWFPYLNRGNAYFDRDQTQLAMKDFEASSALGDQGIGTFNIGSILLGSGKPQLAIQAFDQAERQGYRLYNLPFQRGMALVALGRLEPAYAQFEAALAASPDPAVRELALLNAGRTALQIGKREEAVRHLEQLLVLAPKHKEGRYLLAMAWITGKEFERALPLLDAMLAEEPNGSAFLARAVAHHGLKRKPQALSDIESAIRIGPDNPVLRDWAAKIRAMP